MTEIKESKEFGDPRRKLLQKAFVNKASRMYALEKKRMEGSLEDLSETNLARRSLELLSNSWLVLFDENEMQAWEYDNYSLHFDPDGTPNGLFVKGEIIGRFLEKSQGEHKRTSLDKFDDPLTLNSNIMIEEITDTAEKEMFSTLLKGLAEIDSGIQFKN
ncbi:MAG: hypothetical protein XD93_0208 [candidate division WS6 bacterium 34_10]|jgi:hypothetical protein|uniref:Uncharacterized protein n=1 Tax=candidate division WS6 bacterium 34_10 TaxID=1641389 RepID=A0A117M0I7_9BACT|nr:MAG: hypothetical protein XD93_0208 [candidate division WS6 bacterium 34_10]